MASLRDLDAALSRFQEERPRLERAMDDVLRLLHDILAPTGLHPRLSGRVKDVESFRAKVLAKDYADPWTEVTDKVGVRALVERAGDVDQIHAEINVSRLLPIHNITDKRSQLALDELGYSGLHLDLWAPSEGGDQVSVELQIRTVAQDAWSVVSHKLLYKPKVSLSERDQRSIMRLVALVEIFDEEVQRVMDKQKERELAHSDEPSAAGAEVLEFSEVVAAQFARFTEAVGNRELTSAVLPAVYETLDAGEEYQTLLADFVDTNRDALTQLYADYGPGSAMSATADHVLWSQPESLAILEALERKPHALLHEWREDGLPDAWLRPLVAHSSAELDL